MGLVRSLAGSVRFEITSADTAKVLQEISAAGITLLDITYSGDLTVQGSVCRSDFPAVIKLAEHRGERLNVLGRSGLYWSALRAVHRPVLLIFVCIFLTLVLFLPTRILFVEVEGNTDVSARLILDRAAQCGIRFGASRRAVRSEKVKNDLIAAIPELQWAGVNTRGCVATISVREKSIAQEGQDTQHGVSSIVAARDGVIYECTVTKGNLLCSVGQAVKAGETLVSGYTDCGIIIQATDAEAEITAQTQRELEVVTPALAEKRGVILRKETRYSLQVGKKLINFYKDSGILDATCVKMYSEDYMTLPGGFQLPIALITEQYVFYETEDQLLEQDAFGWLEGFAQDYLKNQMTAGQILNEDTQLQLNRGICYLQGQFACLEMIGQVRNEEILQYDGKSN